MPPIAGGIDNNLDDILNVAHFIGAETHFEERIERNGICACRCETQHRTKRFAKTSSPRKADARIAIGELALHVEHQGRPWPSQQRRHDMAAALARPSRADEQLMLRSVEAKNLASELAEHGPLGCEQSSGFTIVEAAPGQSAEWFETARLYQRARRDHRRNGDTRKSDEARDREWPRKALGPARIPANDRPRRINAYLADREKW